MQFTKAQIILQIQSGLSFDLNSYIREFQLSEKLDAVDIRVQWWPWSDCLDTQANLQFFWKQGFHYVSS